MFWNSHDYNNVFSINSDKIQIAPTSKAFQMPKGDHAYYNVDHFSGEGSVAHGFRGRGHRVARLDLVLNAADVPWQG